MALVINDFADALKNGLGFSAEVTSFETKGFADAVITALGAALVSHASGSVTGTAPPTGGPLQDGAATGGTIDGLLGPTLASLLQIKMGKPSITTELSGLAEAIVTHLSAGEVEFATGNITGTCTNTASNPGVLTGEGSGGTIIALDGPTLAALAASFMGKGSVSQELEDFCTEFVNYIMNNAEVTYGSATVTATCPAGGGNITLGTGVGGTIA